MKAKKIIKNYLIIAAIIYIALYLINKKLFWIDVVSPPYP